MESDTSLSLAAGFLGLAPKPGGVFDPEEVKDRVTEYVAECEELQRNPRANRIQLNKARAALAQIGPWLPGLEIAARLAKLERESGGGDLAQAARLRLEIRKLTEAVAALPAGDERELFSLQLSQVQERVTATPGRAKETSPSAPAGKTAEPSPPPVFAPGASGSGPVSPPPPSLTPKPACPPPTPTASGPAAVQNSNARAAAAPVSSSPLSAPPAAAPSPPSANAHAPLFAPVQAPTRNADLTAPPLPPSPIKAPVASQPSAPPPLPPAPPAPTPPPSRPAPPPPPPPRIHEPARTDGWVGKPFSCELIAEGEGVRWSAEDLPPGLTLGDDGRLVGTPTRAGTFSIRITARSPHGRDELRLSLPILQTVPAPAPLDRFTLLQPNGRKLHVWGTPQLRLGRTNESDFPVFACVRGNPSATKALTGEISRQHAELWFEPPPGGAFIRDGWRPGATGSSFGTTLDGRRLSATPSRLQNDQVLQLSNREADAGMPGWKVRVVESAGLGTAPEMIRANAPAHGLCGVWLGRLDVVPDDMLLLRSACDLGALAGTGSGPWLWRHGAGFLLVGASGEAVSPERVETVWPGARLVSSGKIEPTGLRELLVLT